MLIFEDNSDFLLGSKETRVFFKYQIWLYLPDRYDTDNIEELFLIPLLFHFPIKKQMIEVLHLYIDIFNIPQEDIWEQEICIIEFESKEGISIMNHERLSNGESFQAIMTFRWDIELLLNLNC